MDCEYPVKITNMLVRCQRCDTCRASRVAEWSNRMLLEAEEWNENTFVTLTYNERSLPADGSLNPADLSLFLKRLRKRLVGRRIRFYGVGEYGDQFGRPHYHAILFNVPSCARGVTYQKGTWATGALCCPACTTVQAAWSVSGEPIGNVRLGTVEEASTRYVAGYILKGATRTDDVRLSGKWPEFARMSNRPGIGYYAMHDVADRILTYDDPIPRVLGRGKKFFPYGRYLRNKLMEMCGVDKEEEKKKAVEAEVEKLSVLSAMAKETGQSWQGVYQDLNRQRILNWKARQKTKRRILNETCEAQSF